MELQIRVQYTNGNAYTQGNVVQDLNGCGTEPIPLYPVDYTSPNPIAQARAQLWATEGGVPFVKVDESNWKDHPDT